MTAPTTTPSQAAPATAPKRRQKNRWRRLAPPLIVLAVVAVAIALGYRQIQGARASATAGIDTRPVTRGNLSATVSAAGNLQPIAQVNLNFSSGGIVKEVLVKEGDRVKAGQPLVRLQADELELAVVADEANLRNAKLKLDQASAGPKSTDLAEARSKVTSAEAGLSALYTGPTAAELADAQARLTSARANLDKVKSGPTELEIANAREKLENAKNSLWGAQSNRDSICGRAKHPDEDPSCNQQRASVNSAEGNVRMAENDLEKLLAGPNANDVISAEQNVRQAEAALAKLRQGPTADKVASAQSSVVSAQSALEELTAGPDEINIKLAQSAVEQAEVKLKQSQLKLKQATISAPFDGVITQVTVVAGQNVGGSSNPVQIADLNTLQVVTNVSELDRSRLKVGQEVSLTLEAVPGVTLKGEVVSISPAGVTQQGVVNFPVTIRLINPDPAVTSGMTANLNVLIEKKDNVLIVPNRAIRSQGRARTVTVLYEGQQIPVPVQTGMTDGTNTEITSGALKEGDQVVVTSTAGARPGQGGGFGPGAGGGPPPGAVIVR